MSGWKGVVEGGRDTGRSVHKLLRTWLGLLIIVLKREESACAATDQ